MLNEYFPAHLSKFISKTKEDEVVVEFQLTHTTSEGDATLFLQEFASEFQYNLMNCFRSNPEWKAIKFDYFVPKLSMKFDGMDLKADLVGINVTQKETASEIKFKYDLIFNKSHEPDIDSVFATTYLKRKEENEDGKKVLVEYDTLIEQ